MSFPPDKNPKMNDSLLLGYNEMALFSTILWFLVINYAGNHLPA
jgi:hypothetical protein